MKTSILLIRHGQSTWNAQGKWQGQADPDLSELGRQQAFQAAQSLGVVDAIITSPQKRAVGTAMIISEQIGVGPLQLEELLRERNVGEWSGLTRQEIDARWPNWEETGMRPQQWEPDESVASRALAAIEKIAQHFAGGTLLLVAHSGILIALEKHLGVFDTKTSNLCGRTFFYENGAITSGERILLIDSASQTGGGNRHQV